MSGIVGVFPTTSSAPRGSIARAMLERMPDRGGEPTDTRCDGEAELGIVNAPVLRQRWGEFVRRGGGNLAMNLLFTLQAELWLRTRRNKTTIPSRSSLKAPDLAPALAG